MDENLRQWLKSGAYLPDCLKDFHDQKDVFKRLDEMASNREWVNGDRIGQWADEQEALIAMQNKAIAEATEIDLSRPWTDEDTESLDLLVS